MNKKNVCGPDALREVVTFILAGGRGERLYPLTRDRSKPSVPFGGTYRIIDFALSNCVNSGLRRLYVLPQYKSFSLNQHLRVNWNLFSTELGEYITAIPPQLRVGSNWYMGTADAVYQNVYTLEQERPAHVMILSGDHIYRMDYRMMITEHLETGADVTLAVMSVPAREGYRFGIVETDEGGRVVGFREKPKDLDPEGPEVVANMGVYVFKTELLVKALMRDSRLEDSKHDFGYNVLPALLAGGANMRSHVFEDVEEGREPYWMDIGTLDAYYEATMDLVSVSPSFNLYDRSWPLRSQRLIAPPAKFVFAGGEEGRIGEARDSLISPGVIVSGGQVHRSVLAPYCRVNSWASVEDSILFDGVEVGRHAMIRRAIIDKGVQVPAGMRIGVDPEEDRKRFLVTESGVVVIPKGERLDEPSTP